VPGDYDGDGRTDPRGVAPSSGAWFILLSSTGQGQGLLAGARPATSPCPADYDGDGRTDLAVWRSSGGWFIFLSSAGQAWPARRARRHIPVPADYDGDGRTDLAVWRPTSGAWFIFESSTGQGCAVGWGARASDVPGLPTTTATAAPISRCGVRCRSRGTRKACGSS
jgi:hypothetical protein